MGVVNAELAAARRAFARPTLALLNKTYAPAVIALFATVFSANRKAVPADQFHIEIAEHLDELRTFHQDELPDGTARKLASNWVRDKWLVRSVNDQGQEQYALTSNAQEAMDFVSRSSGERAYVSESRIRTLLDTVERFALDAQPDRAKRVRALNTQIRALTAEKKRLEAGGEIEPTSAERMEEQFDNVKYLVRELPADFTRVAESIKELQRAILSQLRQDERPTGEVLAEYLTASENLLEQTSEGKAFTGALELLKSEELLGQLDASIEAILTHPFARELGSRERESFRAIKSTILEALGVVLTEQQRASRTLTAQIRNHNPLRDRELDDALRAAVVAVGEWFPTSGRGESVEALTRFERVNFGRLRTGLHDLHDDAPPAAIAQNADVEISGLDLEDIIAMGGPRHRELMEHVEELLNGGDGDAELTVAQAFSSGADSLKRPVEILGYQEIAAHGAGLGASAEDGADSAAGSGFVIEPGPHAEPSTAAEPAAHGTDSTAPIERVIAIRADGTTREFIVPRQSLTSTHKGQQS